MEKETGIKMSAVVAEGVNYLLGVENQEVVNPSDNTQEKANDTQLAELAEQVEKTNMEDKEVKVTHE